MGLGGFEPPTSQFLQSTFHTFISEAGHPIQTRLQALSTFKKLGYNLVMNDF